MKLARLFVCASLLGGQAVAQEAPQPGPQRVMRQMRPPPPAMTGEQAELPMELIGGMPVIAATVNGKGPYRFGVDTGAAGYLRLSEELAASLGLLQVFLGVVAGTALLLGAAVAERNRAIAVREELMSVASHELRGPLGPLRMQLLRAHGAEGMRDGRGLKRALEGAERQIDRLARLIDVLLDLTRVSAGQLELHVEA